MTNQVCEDDDPVREDIPGGHHHAEESAGPGEDRRAMGRHTVRGTGMREGSTGSTGSTDVRVSKGKCTGRDDQETKGYKGDATTGKGRKESRPPKKSKTSHGQDIRDILGKK